MRRMTAVGGVFAVLAAAVVLPPQPAAGASTVVEAPAVVVLKPAPFTYWATGEFSVDGKPVDAPQRTAMISAEVSIMTRQVTAAEYGRCVEDKACPPLLTEQDGLAPVVMVSWAYARAYAAWLSKKVGARYRLPTDEEWIYAAGSRAPAETPLIGAGAVARWVERYDRESQAQPAETLPQPVGHFGANEKAILDIAGNVWEWTDTCYTRTILDSFGNAAGRGTKNCGVRVAEGRHRAYVVDFVRDARAGGCAAGVPPSNLGFRLVRERKGTWSIF